MNKKTFEPNWINSAPNEKSFRSIFKWGNPQEFKHPNKRLYFLLKNTFNLKDSDFIKPDVNPGDEEVKGESKINISKNLIEKFIEISGKKNVETELYSRKKIFQWKNT
jgi:alkyldihydroxyacetonephosphate synthase